MNKKCQEESFYKIQLRYIQRKPLDIWRLGFIYQILHNIFHNVKITSSGEILNSDFTVWFPLKNKKMAVRRGIAPENFDSLYPNHVTLKFNMWF